MSQGFRFQHHLTKQVLFKQLHLQRNSFKDFAANAIVKIILFSMKQCQKWNPCLEKSIMTFLIRENWSKLRCTAGEKKNKTNFPRLTLLLK